MTLTSVGIDGCSGVAQGLYQCYISVGVPLERVEVVVYKYSLGPALAGQFESLDYPVVACSAVATQCLAHVFGTALVRAHGLVHHVDHLQIGILSLHLIHPLHDGLVAFLGRETLYPTGVLRTPHQCVELKLQVVVLGIVICRIGTVPVILSARTFNCRPLSTVLGRNLIPVVRILKTGIVHRTRPVGSDVTKKLVGVS